MGHGRVWSMGHCCTLSGRPIIAWVMCQSYKGQRLFSFALSPHGVEPTLYGRALLKRGVAAFDELKQGLRDIEFLADPTVGEFRIGCPDSVVAAILPRMIGKFCRDFPGIALRFDQVPTPTLELPDLHTRKLDAVIAWLSNSA